MLDIDSELFREKVYGCWLGKNSGGTLGTPLEKTYGEPEPFDVWWYPKLQEGGIPNDDLEMQLIWLKALEEVGPDIKAADLAQYWLKHIGYNWDEYGLSKTNLRLGLLPPVSGTYNNWFKDCMGCPIRSEIWACIAPGVPRLAVRYAYEDAICDHAGGESVFGELFNTALESAAFVVSDREQLLDIGLSYVPPESQTAKAIQAARQSYADGVDWKIARQRVLEATPHYNAQYSPINIGFQVIGWLYGEDFGDALCKTVNCGYDTDSSGATIGSFLGIIAGKSGLPQRWTAPLGETIATTESWGGIRGVSTGDNPISKNLTELTERIVVQARRILTYHQLLNASGQLEVNFADLYADETIEQLWSANPLRIDYQQGSGQVQVGIAYEETPAVVAGEQKQIITHLRNPYPEAVEVVCQFSQPVNVAPQQVTIPALTDVALSWSIPIPPLADLENRNQFYFQVEVIGHPAQPAIPVVLIGAARYRHTQVYSPQGRSERELFDLALAGETTAGEPDMSSARQGDWTEFSALENALPLENVFQGAGTLYVQTFLWNSGAEQPAWIGVPATCPRKVWINGQLIIEQFNSPLLRPNYDGDGSSYAAVSLREGWNEVLIKFVRGENAVPFAAHFMLSDGTPAHHHAGFWQIGRTRLPWDK